jgi:hypothetical protein
MNEISQWAALAGIAVSMLTLAGSAVAYVVRLYLDTATKRRDQFFELMKFLDSPAPIAAKSAAVYQLRSFPQHRDFIIRFCTNAPQFVSGTAAQPLLAEFAATREFFERTPP